MESKIFLILVIVCSTPLTFCSIASRAADPPDFDPDWERSVHESEREIKDRNMKWGLYEIGHREFDGGDRSFGSFRKANFGKSI